MTNTQIIPKKPRTPQEVGHQARKRFGQNFLHDETVIWQIAESIGLQRDDNLLEIGPGLGALTQVLLTFVDGMTAIELDRDLASRLKMHIGANAHRDLTIINGNALAVDFYQLKAKGDGKWRVVGNLPYNISTPILFYLLNFSDIIQDMHFMLQKEVVERIVAQVGTKAYGRLSVIMQYHCDSEYLLTVPKEAFNPPPKVTSAVFRLTPKTIKPIVADDEAYFALVVRECFNHRRKTLKAIFRSNAILPTLTDDDFISLDIDGRQRPENLSVGQFVKISNWLKNAMALKQ